MKCCTSAKLFRKESNVTLTRNYETCNHISAIIKHFWEVSTFCGKTRWKTVILLNSNRTMPEHITKHLQGRAQWIPKQIPRPKQPESRNFQISEWIWSYKNYDLHQIVQGLYTFYIYAISIMMYLFYPKTISIFFSAKKSGNSYPFGAGTSKVKVFTAFFRSMAALENITFWQRGNGGKWVSYKASWCWKLVGIYSFYKTWLGISFCCWRMSWSLRHMSSKMKKQTSSQETHGAIPDVSTSTPSIPSVSRPTKWPKSWRFNEFPDLNKNTNKWQKNKEQTIPRPSSFLNCFTTLVTLPFPKKTAGKSRSSPMEKELMGFHLDMPTYANLPHHRRTTFWLQLHHVHDQSNVKLE